MELGKTHQGMDRISTLPQDIIEKILTLMPIQDALKTSILSKKWRYCWTRMPALKFSMITSPYKLGKFKKLKLVKNIFHVLLLHKGPILEFSMYVDDKEIATEIYPIILHISRNNDIKRFHFENQLMMSCYELPSSFFSLQGLEQLDLGGCLIKPPLNFNGFNMLRSLGIHDCLVTSNMLQRLLTNCPLLEDLALEACNGLFDVEENKCTYVELFRCLPSAQYLTFYDFRIQNFVEGGMPQKLPTPLVHLRIIFFHVCLQHDDLLFVLNVINNSPNLVRIILKLYVDHSGCVQEEVNNSLDFEDYSDLNLDKLEQLEMRDFQNLTHEIGFVKLIMAKSPVLKKAQMQLSKDVSVDEEVKMLRDLVRLPLPRASPMANFIIKR